jgi:two-component system sensor histidine kinase PilS (NtrC family)
MNAAGRFSQGLAHEIKNPLTSLSGALQLMELSEQDQRLRAIVLREVERLDRLVTDYRDAGQAPELRLARVELGELLQQVAETFSHDVRYAAVALELSGLDRRYFFQGDGDKLRQVLWNLLLNAAQHMPDGGQVALRLEKEGGHALLVVEDQGPGIPADQLPLIFDPFFTQRSGGTGLGLAVVEQVVRAHGGEIRVKSRPGEGTQFLMRFPLEESSA